LYHQIDDAQINRYYISPADFEAQIKAYHDWGYTTISMDLLIRAIREGAELPAKPIVITFDDGEKSTYANAFPIMQKYGMTGVSYLVRRYIGAEGFMTEDEIKILIANGWEIGDHSWNHLDLTQDHSLLDRELHQSKIQLEEMFGVKITSIAYPFGAVDEEVINYAALSGYLGGVQAAGPLYQHNKSLLYILHRLEVRAGMTLDEIAKMIGEVK
jgi:peptidoglycan/xylan/chitin deacetylase (PgdA/CDA1 family)